MEYIKVSVLILTKDEKKDVFLEEYPEHYTDGDITERLWDKYSLKYDDMEEIKWDRV